MTLDVLQKMNQSLFKALLLLADALLVFMILCVLPFAWILRDGLGPDSVQSTGMAMIGKVFMTFYVGPLILVLISFDLLLRRSMSGGIVSQFKLSALLHIALLALLSVLSFIVITLMRG